MPLHGQQRGTLHSLLFSKRHPSLWWATGAAAAAARQPVSQHWLSHHSTSRSAQPSPAQSSRSHFDCPYGPVTPPTIHLLLRLPAHLSIRMHTTACLSTRQTSQGCTFKTNRVRDGGKEREREKLLAIFRNPSNIAGLSLFSTSHFKKTLHFSPSSGRDAKD